jgi:hypothetical protein
MKDEQEWDGIPPLPEEITRPRTEKPTIFEINYMKAVRESENSKVTDW